MFKPGYSLGSPLFYNTELNKFILFREDAKISDIDKDKALDNIVENLDNKLEPEQEKVKEMFLENE